MDFSLHVCTAIESPPLSSDDYLILHHQKCILGFKKAQVLLSVVLTRLDIVHQPLQVPYLMASV